MRPPVRTPPSGAAPAVARPRLLDRIERVPPPRERWRRRLRRGLLLGLGAALLVALLALLVLARAYLDSRWTLPESNISARIEEDLQYNITYGPSRNRVLNINFTTDEIIHLGNPTGGVERLLARVERNQTENRFSYQLKNERNLLVATATEVRVANRPLFDKTAIVSRVENGVLLDPAGGSRPAYTSYAVNGKRLHEQSRTTTSGRGAERRLINTLVERSEWWGWFGDRARSGTLLLEYGARTPRDLAERLARQHAEWQGQQTMRMSNPFQATLHELRSGARVVFRSDEGWPGPWWQLDLLPQGSTLHVPLAGQGGHEMVIHIAWDKRGIFPWRWLNGGYLARDATGELFRVQIRDFWFHFQNELAYLYFLDLNGDGKIDKQAELIGQVFYKTADSPLKESFARKADVALTQENTQEFTRNKTYVFRVGASPEQAERDFLLCDAIEKLLPDALIKGFGRDSHLGYIERARDDFLLARELTAARLHNAATVHDALDWKRGAVLLLGAAGRAEAAAALAAGGEQGEAGFPGLEPAAAGPPASTEMPPRQPVALTTPTPAAGDSAATATADTAGAGGGPGR